MFPVLSIIACNSWPNAAMPIPIIMIIPAILFALIEANNLYGIDSFALKATASSIEHPILIFQLYNILTNALIIPTDNNVNTNPKPPKIPFCAFVEK